MLKKLLAAPERIHTELGQIMHNSGKLLIRKAIKSIGKKYEPVVEYKKEHGWIKDHVAAMEEGWKKVEYLMLQPINHRAGIGWTGKEDKNAIMYNTLLPVFFTMVDEDSAYDWPLLIWLKWIHDHWDRFEESAEQAYQLLDFAVTYEHLMNWTEPLPLDDGTDIEEIDYVKREKEIMDGIHHDNEKKK